MSVSLAEKPAKRKQAKRKNRSAIEPLPPIEAQRLDPHNAILITPAGQRISVDITPEAAAVWARYGCKVEFMPVTVKVPA